MRASEVVSLMSSGARARFRFEDRTGRCCFCWFSRFFPFFFEFDNKLALMESGGPRRSWPHAVLLYSSTVQRTSDTGDRTLEASLRRA
jgi:hypothetical protein